jgi:hypothetical protein
VRAPLPALLEPGAACLVPVDGGGTEGFDTADLLETRALLEECT